MKRVLLVRLSAMGDVVQSLGAVAALHAARPDLELTFVTQRENEPLLAGLPGLREVVVHDRRGGVRGWIRTRARLRSGAFDVALDLQGNWKSAALARLSAAPRRIGAAGPWRQEPLSACLLNERVEVEGARHPARVALQVVRRLAPEARAEVPRLAASEAEIDEIAAVVRSLGIDPTRPFAVALLGRAGDPRSLRERAIAGERARGSPLLLLAGPLERDVAVPFDLPVLRQQRGQLRRLVALGALVARAGGEVVGGDQGPVHVLAAAGARATVWFGPQDPASTSAPAATVLQHANPPSCMPCRSMRCRHEQGPVCMDFARGEGRELPPFDWQRPNVS